MISIHKANFLNNAPSIPGRSPFGSVPLQRPRGPDVVRVAVGPKTGEALAAISFEDLRLTKDRRVIVKSPLDPVVEPPNLETYGLVAERVVEKKKGCFDPWDFQRNEPKEVVLKWVTEESKKEGEINLSKLLVFIAVKNAVQNAATEKAKQKLLESDGFILEQLEEATTRSLHEAQPASRVVLPGVSVREPDPERIHQKATVVVEGKGKSKMYPEDEDKGHNDEIVPSLEHRKQPFVPWEYNDEQPPKRQRVDSGPGYFASQAPISHTSFQPDLPQLDLSNRQVPPMSDHFSGLIGTSWLHDIGAELLLGSNGVDQVGPTRPSVVPVASVGKGIPTGPSNALASVAGGSTGQAPKDQDQVIVEDEEAPLKTAEKDANVQQSKTDVGEPDSMTFLWETLHTPFPQHTVAENSANWLDYLFHMVSNC